MSFKTIGEYQRNKCNGLTTEGTKYKIGPNKNRSPFAEGKGSKERKIRLDKELKEHAKFVYVNEYIPSNSGFYDEGRIRKFNRYYGIGILTDSNHFTYKEFRMVSCNLTTKTLRKMRHAFCQPYTFDIDTEVVFNSNIKKSDIFLAFFEVMQIVARFSIFRVDRNKMYRKVDQFFRGENKKIGYATKRSMNLYRALREFGEMEFVDGDYDLMIDMAMSGRKLLRVDAAIAMLYIYTKTIKREYNKEYKKKARKEVQ